jgi:hypothetical protein
LVPEASSAVTPDGLRRLDNGWQEFHSALMDQAHIRELLRSSYRHPNVKRDFHPLEYLAYLKLDFTRFQMIANKDYDRFEKTSTESVPESELFRDGTRAATRKRVHLEMKEQGIRHTSIEYPYETFYRSVRTQLYEGRPVLTVINTSLVRGGKARFAEAHVIAAQALVPVGEGEKSLHALVAIGHCDTWETRDPLCRRFAALMREMGVRECIVLQNSWGRNNHSDGYFCLSEEAARRLLTHAWVDHAIIDDCKLQLARSGN